VWEHNNQGKPKNGHQTVVYYSKRTNNRIIYDTIHHIQNNITSNLKIQIQNTNAGNNKLYYLAGLVKTQVFTNTFKGFLGF